MKSIGIKDERLVQETISGEGTDCCLWWTLSPYIFDELKSKTGEKEAVKSLLEWAMSGRPYNKIEDKQVNLSGLDIYNFAGRGFYTFILSRDSSDMSHKFARKEAQRLMYDVFSN